MATRNRLHDEHLRTTRLDPASEPITSIASGAAIEVWCPSVGRWASGFELVEWAGERCWIRRAGDPSDGVLPELFRADDVRLNQPAEPGRIGRNLGR